MPGMWLLLFLAVPAVELYLLVVVGSRLGIAATVGVILLTGIVGWSLVRRQGFSTLQRIQAELGSGRLPALEMASGVVLLGAGLLLITPGFLTDTVGFLMLVPPLRRVVAGGIVHRLQARVVVAGPWGPAGGEGVVIDVDAVDPVESDSRGPV